MAKPKGGPKAFTKPELVKTPFGGVPKTGAQPSDMLPSRHALAKLAQGATSQPTITQFGRATPIGSGAPNPYEKMIENGDF
jgi:hypothetical protein